MSDVQEPPQTDSYADDTVSLLDLIAVLAHRWRLIFFTTFFAAIFVVLFSLYTLRLPPDSEWNPLPNVYASEALVLLSDPAGGGGLSGALGDSELGLIAGLAGNSGGQGSSSAALAQELIRGRTLIDTVVEQFGLLETFADADSPRTAARQSVSEALTAEFDSASGILTVTYEHIDPEFATDVLQLVMVRLEERFSALTRSSARDRELAIQLQLSQLEDEVQQARTALTNFQKRYGVIDPESQGLQTLELMSRFRQQKFELELERQQILNLVRDPEDPQIRRIDEQIASIDNLINELQTGFRLYSPLSIPLDEVGTLTVEFEELRRDLLLREQIFANFQLELIRARLERQDTTSRFQILEPPEVPQVKAGPSRGMISIIVTITAFFLSVFLAFILEYFYRAKDDSQERRKIEFIRDQFRFGKGKRHEA